MRARDSSSSFALVTPRLGQSDTASRGVLRFFRRAITTNIFRLLGRAAADNLNGIQAIPREVEK